MTPRLSGLKLRKLVLLVLALLFHRLLGLNSCSGLTGGQSKLTAQNLLLYSIFFVLGSINSFLWAAIPFNLGF